MIGDRGCVLVVLNRGVLLVVLNRGRMLVLLYHEGVVAIPEGSMGALVSPTCVGRGVGRFDGAGEGPPDGGMVGSQEGMDDVG